MKGFLMEQRVTVPRARLAMFLSCAPGFSAHQLKPLGAGHPEVLQAPVLPLGWGQISQAFTLKDISFY